MSSQNTATLPVDELRPQAAWSALAEDNTAQLIDVRTRPEWGFVGVPDLSDLGRQPVLLEWRVFPSMQVNAGFAETLLEQLGDDVPAHLLFICRSGARSMEAATEVSALCASRGLTVRCTNVAEGFEGDLDRTRHRGVVNGWKANGLAWLQN